MKTLFLPALMFLFVLPSTAAEKRLALIYTNSLNGYLDYCTCKADPKGGLVKRATAFSKLRKEYKGKPLIAVDTGDFFPVYTSDLLPPYLMKALESIRYDAITFGDQDLDFGIPNFIRLSERLPVVNTNLVFPKRSLKNPFPPYRIVRSGNVAVAILAVQSKKAYTYTREVTRKSVTISDPETAVRETLASIKKEKVDAVIVLSHCGYDEDTAFAGKLSGASIIVGGHSQTLVEKPAVTNGVCVLQAGSNGAHIGVCELTLDGAKVKATHNRFIVPDMHQPEDDPYIRSLIKEHRDAEDAATGSFD